MLMKEITQKLSKLKSCHIQLDVKTLPVKTTGVLCSNFQYSKAVIMTMCQAGFIPQKVQQLVMTFTVKVYLDCELLRAKEKDN